MQKISRYVRDRRGQALVEFALILPAFLLLVVGMIEFGAVMHDYITVAEAARAGARLAILVPAPSDTAVIAAAKSAAPSIDPAKLTVTVSPGLGGRTTGQPVTVTVSYPIVIPYPTIPNIFSSNPNDSFRILPNVVPVTGTAVMRKE